MTDLEYIAENLSEEDILCQIAEEAAELSKAALKLRRALEVIRDECRKYETCSDKCPLYIKGADGTHLDGYCPIVEGYNPWECEQVWEDKSNGD